MKIDLDNISALVRKEASRAIREVMGSHLNENDDERRRQKRMADELAARNLDTPKDSRKEQVAEEEETLETGVPATTDSEKKAKKEKPDGPKGTKDSPKLATPSDEKISRPTIGAVIDKLNALRGGKSLKDPAVKKAFAKYFDNLTGPERSTLLIFVTGISQILSGLTSGDAAIEPGDSGLKIKSANSKKEEPSIKKAAEKKSEESGTESTPIVVGESTSSAKNVIRAYKRHTGEQ